MKCDIDRPVAQLILDLEDRGLLDRTLVILASEFSRDMMIEGVPGSKANDQSRAKTDVLKSRFITGCIRHFTGSSSVLMFGGGDETRISVRRDGGRAAVPGDEGQARSYRYARHDHAHDGDQSANRV